MKTSEQEVYEVTITVGPQSLENKVSAAVHVAVIGIGQVGVKTKAQLMWPCMRFCDADVRKEAATLLDHLLSLQLASLPHQAIEQIQRDQDKRLSLIVES